MSETDIKKQITDFLDTAGIFWRRMNAGGYRGRMRGVPKGTADLLVIPVKNGNPVVLWCEVKRPGEKQSKEQIEFERDVTAKGMQYLVATDVGSVAEYITAMWRINGGK